MSDERTAEPGGDPSAAPPRHTRASAALSEDEPVGRALLSRNAESRDWADTGDPDYEPALEGDSAGPDAGAGAGDDTGDDTGDARGDDAQARPWRSLPDEDTVMLTRPTFAGPAPAGDPAAPVGPPTDEQAAAARASARQRLAEQVAANAELAAVLSERDAAALSEREAAAREAERAARPARDRQPRRQPVLLQGLFPALVAAGLMLASSLGVVPLAVAVLALQITLLLGALALLDAPAAGGAFLVATGAVVAGDAVVLLGDGSISGLTGVVGLGVVGALAHQLARPGRSRVTESLADTLVVIVFGVAAACLIALYEVEGGQEVLLVSLAAAGAVLLAGRVGDRIAPQPVLAVGSTRGWPGLLLGLGAGVAAAATVASLAGEPPLRSAFLLGLVVASTVATADLAVDLGAAELRRGWRDARRVAALRPTGLLLPYAVLGPVALLAGRLLLS